MSEEEMVAKPSSAQMKPEHVKVANEELVQSAAALIGNVGFKHVYIMGYVENPNNPDGGSVLSAGAASTDGDAEFVAALGSVLAATLVSNMERMRARAKKLN